MSIAEDKLQGYDKKLENNLFFKGPQPSNEDAEVLEELTKEKCVPDQEKFPNLFAWYSLVILFKDEVVATWKKPEQHQKGKNTFKELIDHDKLNYSDIEYIKTKKLFSALKTPQKLITAPLDVEFNNNNNNKT